MGTRLKKLYLRLVMRWQKMGPVKNDAGVVARVESLRGRNSPFEAREEGMHPVKERRTFSGTGAGVVGLFGSVLSESFGW